MFIHWVFKYKNLKKVINWNPENKIILQCPGKYCSHKCEWSLSVLSDSLCPLDCSPPGSSVHVISQARILEWVAISSSRGSSWLRDLSPVFHIAGRLFTIWVTREAVKCHQNHWDETLCLGAKGENPAPLGFVFYLSFQHGFEPNFK